MDEVKMILEKLAMVEVTVCGKIDALLGEVAHIRKAVDKEEGNDPILEFADVCHILNLSERQVHRYKKEGKLVGFLLGKRRMYRNSEVQRFLKEREEEARLRELV